MKSSIFSILLLLSLSLHASEIVLIGDSGKDNQGQASVAEALKQYCTTANCQLGILAGDNIYPEGMSSENDPILERMFDKHYNQLNIPFLIALGNHDYGKLSNDWKRGDWQHLHAKKNPKFVIPHFWYTYESPEAVISVIDTSRLMWRKNTFAQSDMLLKAKEAAEKAGKWFIVVGHHPYLSNGKHGNAGNYERLKVPYFASGSNVQKFLERFVCGKAQFYLSGHDHNLQVFDGKQASCDTHLVISGSAASYTPLMKRNVALYEASALGFFHLSVTRDSVHVKAIDQKLVVQFEKTYTK
jgi:tartrate-resistant acid phosphatase type 5